MTGSLADAPPGLRARARRADRHHGGSVCAADRVRAGTERGDGRSGRRSRRSSGPTRTSAGRSPTTRGSSSTRRRIPSRSKRRSRATWSSPGRPRTPIAPPVITTLAESRERLLEATTQTVLAAAGAEQPAVAARWWVAVPYSPRLESAREQLRSLAARSRGRTLWSAHRDAAIESARVTSQIEAALRAAGIETYPLNGTQTLALLWERLHPATDTECDLDRLAAACRVATATTIEEARDARHALVLAACDGAECGIDAGEDAGWLRHADGTLEEVLHLGSPPAYTDAVVALAPALLPAAGHARGAHRRRRPRSRAGAPAPPVEAASRRGALQGTPRPRRRLRRAGSARGGRSGRRGARRRDRRERLPGRDLLLDPGSARPARAVQAHRQSRPRASSTR